MSNFKKISDWEVLTPNGWSEFKGVQVRQKDCYIKMVFDDGTILECSENHKIKLLNGKFEYVKNIELGTSILALNGNKILVSKEKIDGEIDLYDLIEVKKNREFYSNDILSSNCAFIEKAEEIWAAAQPTLSCLDKNTLILSDMGLIRLETFINSSTKLEFNPVNIKTHDGDNMVDVSSFYKSEKSDLYEVEFESGGKIVGTENHPLMTKSGWKTIGDLNENEDAVLCKYSQNVFGSSIDYTKFNPHIRKDAIVYKFSNEEIAYLCGIWTAEGHICKKTVGITNTDKEITDWLKEKGFKCYDDRHYYLSSVWMVNLLKWIGCEGTAHTKRIPERILAASQEEQIAFLQGLFDGDGCSLGSKGIKLTSGSYELLSNVRVVLLNMGINSYIRNAVWKSTKSTVIKDKTRIFSGYELHIGGFDAHSFYSTIGFRIKRKQLGWQKLSRKSIKRIFPDKTIVKNLILESGMSVRKFSKKHKCYYDRYLWYEGKGLSITSVETLLDVMNGLNTSENYKLLKQQYDKDISEYYDKVVSIKFLRNDYSYDLRVPSTEKFLANGYINHNTGGKAILLSCVTKDTMVLSSNGISEMEDFIDTSKTGGYQRNDYGILGVDKIRYSNLIYNNGIQDTLKIKTKFSELECTKNHKLWAFKKDTNSFGWYKSEELGIGDFLSMQIGMNIWGDYCKLNGFKPSTSNKIHSPFCPTEITTNLAYLFGLYIAEGSSYKVKNKLGEMVGGSITITCGDDISWVFETLGLFYNCWDGIHYTVSNKNLLELFEYVGFDLSLKAINKKIPKNLLKMSRENIRWMLKGIFDGDGGGTKNIVQLTSTSKELIKQIRFILMNFGILSGVCNHSKEKMNSYRGKIKHNNGALVLEMNGRNALKFYNEIGFNLERKQKNKYKLSLSNLKRACSHDVVPNTLSLIKLLIDKTSLNGKELYEKTGLFLNGYLNKKTPYKTSHLSRQDVLFLYSLFGNFLSDVEQTNWNRILKENIVWCEIKNIESSKNETFDFSLPQNDEDFWCHSVIYNGVIGHQTPNGVGNFFHKMWVQAEENRSKFFPIKLPWHLHPERDKNWRDEQDRVSENLKKTAQELDCDFLSSGATVIDLVLLAWFKQTYMKDPVEKRGIDQNYWIWQYPSYTTDTSYAVAADVARGDGEDFSSFHVLNVKTMEQCAEYKGHISTKDFGNMLVSVATDYNNALLIVEREGPGWATLQQIIDRSYPNTFYGSSDLKYVDVEQQMTNKYYTEDKKLVPGFATTLRTRPTIISNLCQYFVDKSITIYSKRTYSELEVFIWENHKPQAARGYNDDLVMALAIGIWVRDTALRLQMERTNLTRATLDQIVVKKTSETPMYKIGPQRAKDTWSMPVGPTKSPWGSKNESLTWLLD